MIFICAFIFNSSLSLSFAVGGGCGGWVWGGAADRRYDIVGCYCLVKQLLIPNWRYDIVGCYCPVKQLLIPNLVF